MASFPVPKKPFSGYGSLLGDSWKTIWRKPVVFFPMIYTYVVFIAFVLIMVEAVRAVLGTDMVDEALLMQHVPGLVGLGALGLLVAVFLAFHTSSLTAWFYGEVAKGRNPRASKGWSASWSLFGRVAKLLLATFVIVLPLIIIMVWLMLAITSLGATGMVKMMFINWLIIGLLVIVFLAVLLVLGAWLLFSIPLLVYTKQRTWEIIGTCWKLFTKDRGHVWSTYLLNLGISVGASIAVGIVLALVSVGVMISVGSWETPGWNLVSTIIRTVVNVVLSVWLMLFVFKSFLARYRPKGA